MCLPFLMRPGKTEPQCKHLQNRYGQLERTAEPMAESSFQKGSALAALRWSPETDRMVNARCTSRMNVLRGKYKELKRKHFDLDDKCTEKKILSFRPLNITG